MGVLSDNPQKEPLHYGEIFGMWTYLAAAKGAMSKYQTMINHVGDIDLKRLMEDIVQNEIKPQIEKIEQILKVNGIGLPPSSPEPPVATLEDIPEGARVKDPEIAMAISAELAAGLVACSTMMGQAIREDIGAMFGQFHTSKAQLGLRALRLNKEKGWLIPPPLHTNVPEPAHV